MKFKSTIYPMVAALLLLSALVINEGRALASAPDAETVKRDIMSFHSDPRAFYGERIVYPTPETVKLRSKKVATFEEAENAVAKAKPNASRGSNFEASFSDIFTTRNWQSFADLKYNDAKLSVQPWSDSYWPIASGGIGARYADKTFAAISIDEWKKAATYIYKTENSLVNIMSAGDEQTIDNLSPAEKYDLLIGDTHEPVGSRFVDYRWSEGAEYFKQDGKVETWMGICHGWAPASYRVKRPTGTVTVLAADGVTPIHFYPADIKALASQLWATSAEEGVTIGRLCPAKKPKTDPKTGRPKNPECLGVNPADWHLLTIYQIATKGDGLLADMSTNREVWNQPVFGYELSYFNPQTGVTAKRLKDAIVDRETFTSDPYSKFRSPTAVKFVGVAMKTHYLEETDPTHKKTDSAKDDDTETVTYYYDLEIDSDGQLIGGEWYKADHPSLAAIEAEGAYPSSTHELSATGDWSRNSPLPQSWIDAANANKANSQVLSAIVKNLVTWSRSASAR